MKATATTLFPFVPSGPDFAAAIDFFIELGFSKVWQGDGLASLRFGGAFFLLQDVDVPEWQKNQMLVLEVDDLDLYWSEIATKNLTAQFAGVAMREPTDYPWGREVHIVDPAGVCWHIRQQTAKA